MNTSLVSGIAFGAISTAATFAAIRNTQPPAADGSPDRIDRKELDWIFRAVIVGTAAGMLATAGSSSTIGRTGFGAAMGIASGYLMGEAGAHLLDN